MKIYLDDIRSVPEGFTIARTVSEVKACLLNFDVEVLSLDHDLGNNYETGYDLVKWMAENNLWPTEKIIIHSMNPVGKENMYKTIIRYAPENIKVELA